jgi:hypothetical protein
MNQECFYRARVDLVAVGRAIRRGLAPRRSGGALCLQRVRRQVAEDIDCDRDRERAEGRGGSAEGMSTPPSAWRARRRVSNSFRSEARSRWRDGDGALRRCRAVLPVSVLPLLPAFTDLKINHRRVAWFSRLGGHD